MLRLVLSTESWAPLVHCTLVRPSSANRTAPQSSSPQHKEEKKNAVQRMEDTYDREKPEKETRRADEKALKERCARKNE